MYFTDITNPELQYFHRLNAPYNFNLSLSKILTSDLFIVETIITDSIYRIYPMFYCNEITSTNPDDKILENKCIIANKNTEETYFDFISDDKDILKIVNLTGYKQINSNLTMGEFNRLIYQLKHKHPFKEEIQINNSTVHGKYADYLFDLESTTIVDNGILITNETLTNIGTITLINPRFRNSTYTIKMKVYSISDVNVCTDASTDNITVTPLTITLQNGTPVNIPFEILDLDHVIGFDATINIAHDKPIIKVNESLILSSNISNLTIGKTAVLTAIYLDETGEPVSDAQITFYDGETVLGSKVTNGYGIATFNFIPSVSGNHNITCKNPNDLTSNTVSLIVSKKIPVLTLSASRRSAGLDIIDIAASIKYEGVGISGVTLQVLDSSDNVIVSTLTNSSGEISDMIQSNTGYTLRAYYAGDATYNSAYSRSVVVKPIYNDVSITEVDSKTILSYNGGTNPDTATLRAQLLDTNENPVEVSNEPVEFWSIQNSRAPETLGYKFEINRNVADTTNIKIGDDTQYILLTDTGLTVYYYGNYLVETATNIVNIKYTGPDGHILSYTDNNENTHYIDLDEYSFYFDNVVASGNYVFHNLMGVVNTDATGKADKIYTSAGVGDISFYASCGTFVSKTYSLEDCMDYQAMTDNSKQSRWTIPSAVTSSSIFGYSSAGWKFGNASSYSAISLNNGVSLPCSIEFYISSVANTANYQPITILKNGETTIQALLGDDDNTIFMGDNIRIGIPANTLIRLELETNTQRLYVNDILKSTKTKTLPISSPFEFHTGVNRMIELKEFKIKPL